MKLQKFTCAAVLSALVLGAVGPTVFAAEEARSIDGKGTIQYKINDESENEGNEVIDPENPDEKVTVDPEEGGNNNDKKGELRVEFLSNLKFGEQKITTGAGEYFASATNAKNKADEDIKRGNFIQVTDQRADGTPAGWTLSAEVTSPFTNTGGVALDGAQITYTLPFVNSSQKAENFPVAESVVVLETSGGSKTMASAAAGKGWGAYAIEYGRPSLDANGKVVEDGTGTVAPTMDEAVKLNVPANTPLDITTAYEAEITWTIANL